MPDLPAVSLTGPDRALVLLRDTRGSATGWARRGLGPVTVVPGLAWTLVVPAGPARSAPPYDDPMTLLAGRPVPRRLRPTACFVAGPDRLAIQVQGPHWRATGRWLIWARGIGLSRVPDLDMAPPGLVARLLAPTRESGERLTDVLARDNRRPAEVADQLLGLLALPGIGILGGSVDAATLPGATLVEPEGHLVARFDAVAHDEHEAARERGDRT
jgi:hypothetical protein